jgi:hypothetical protein
MAWTDPPARQTGDLVTAEIWNADVVDNLLALRAENFRGVYDSGWFAVTLNTLYQKAHGLGGLPRLVVLLWAASPTPSDWHVVTSILHEGGAARGPAIYPTASAVRIHTGNHATHGTICTAVAESGAGYYRVVAWR